MSSHQLERNEKPSDHRVPTAPFTFSLEDKSNLKSVSSRERTRRERYNSVPTVKLLSLHWKKKAHQQHRPMSAHFSSSCHLFIIWYHIIQSFESDRRGLWWAAGGRSGWCLWRASLLAGALPWGILCRCRSAPRLATDRTSSLWTHKVIRWWGKFRISLSPEIWLPLRPISEGKF